MTTDSKQLRRSALARRDAMSEDERREKSGGIRSRLLSLEEILSCRSVFIYVNFRSEVETLPIITELLNLGKKVSVPLTNPAEKQLEAIAVIDPENELVSGYCGIPEPRRELAELRRCAPDELEVIVLPGSVFDERGGRFGYGGGYYDRLLSQVPGAFRIALAFDLQVVDSLPLQDHDELLDVIVTEKRIIRMPNRR